MKKLSLILLSLLLLGFAAIEKERADVPTDAISLDEAARIISNFLEIPALNNIARTMSLGGTVPASVFTLQPGMGGVIMWFCYNQPGGAYPQFFVALEQMQTYDPENLPTAPRSSTLVYAANQFLYTGAGTTQAEVRDFLINHRIGNQFPTASIPGPTVAAFGQNFDAWPVLRDASGERYNKYVFSYFGENDDNDLKNFLAQVGTNGFVRYYYAFDENDKPNRIRMVLIAVDNNGNPITGGEDGGVYILQKSWPPPPYN